VLFFKCVEVNLHVGTRTSTQNYESNAVPKTLFQFNARCVECVKYVHTSSTMVAYQVGPIQHYEYMTNHAFSNILSSFLTKWRHHHRHHCHQCLHFFRHLWELAPPLHHDTTTLLGEYASLPFQTLKFP